MERKRCVPTGEGRVGVRPIFIYTKSFVRTYALGNNLHQLPSQSAPMAVSGDDVILSAIFSTYSLLKRSFNMCFVTFM